MLGQIMLLHFRQNNVRQNSVRRNDVRQTDVVPLFVAILFKPKIGSKFMKLSISHFSLSISAARCRARSPSTGSSRLGRYDGDFGVVKAKEHL
jgi:hypothetical protein